MKCLLACTKVCEVNPSLKSLSAWHIMRQSCLLKCIGGHFFNFLSNCMYCKMHQILQLTGWQKILNFFKSISLMFCEGWLNSRLNLLSSWICFFSENWAIFLHKLRAILSFPTPNKVWRKLSWNFTGKWVFVVDISKCHPGENTIPILCEKLPRNHLLVSDLWHCGYIEIFSLTQT